MKFYYASLLFFCLSFFEINAQNLYGLYYEFESFNDTLGTYSGNQYFVDIDPQTASIQNAIEIDTIGAILLGSSTLDARNGQYFFYGIDNMGQYYLSKVEINTGAVELIPSTQDLAKEMEYDMRTAQLYGLRYNGVADDFVNINLNTAEITVINELSNINATVVGTSAFDSNEGRYFIVGVNSIGTQKLYTIDVENGDILHEVSFAGNLNELAYNVVNDKLIGLHRQDNSNDFELSEIDFTNGSITSIADISSSVTAFVVGAVAFEYQSQTYIINGIDTNGMKRMYNIDALTGAILSDAEIIQNYIEFQADNVVFARSFYPETQEPCIDFVVEANIECVNDNEFYNVILTIENTYDIYEINSTTNGAFNGAVDNFTISDGPFPVGQGFEYKITALGTDCSYTVESSIVSCTVTDLDLISFKVVELDNLGFVNWKTASEKNRSHFEIEKSEDGIQFENIGRVNASNTSIENHYEFIDQNLEETQFYRLKMVEIDGTFEYSNIEKLISERSNFEISEIYPIPVLANVSINITSTEIQTLTVQIFDASGKQVSISNNTINKGFETIEISTNELSNGIYFMNFQNKNGQLKTLKFIKQ